MVEPVSDAHSCCKKSGHSKSLRSLAAGAIAAFLACLCCSVPLIPLMLGLSAGSTLLSLMKYHAVFEALGAAILFASLVYIWHEHKGADKPVLRNPRFWTCLILTFSMYAAMNWTIKHFVSRELAARTAPGSAHEHHQ